MSKSKILVRIALALVCVQFCLLFLPTVELRDNDDGWTWPRSAISDMNVFSESIHGFSWEDAEDLEDLQYFFRNLFYWVVIGSAMFWAIICMVTSSCYKSSVLQMISVYLASVLLAIVVIAQFVNMVEVSNGYSGVYDEVTILLEGYLQLAIPFVPIILLPITLIVQKKEKRKLQAQTVAQE